MTTYQTYPGLNGHESTRDQFRAIEVPPAATRSNGGQSRGTEASAVAGQPHPNGHGPNHDIVAGLSRALLIALGEDPNRDGLRNTPGRIARMYDELLAGYHTDPATLVNGALFDVQYDEMVIVRDIDYFSLCEHHMLPFFGRAHVAYLPKDKVIGLSKIPRLVEMFARRLQIQERMTRQIADVIQEILNPRGVAVVVEGAHMCSMMRGVKKEHTRMTTSAMLGAFRDDPATRNEFRQLLQLAAT